MASNDQTGLSPATQAFFNLRGITAVVTGGTRGIGKSVAIALAGAGADIILVQRDPTDTTTASAIRALSRSATIYAADLSSPPSVAALTARILADPSAASLRLLVNCAGIQRRHAAAAFPAADWEAVLQVNLGAVFALSRDLGAHMLALPPAPALRRRGSVVNFASLLSFQGGLTVPAYAAAKGGVAQLTKALSNEWAARGVNVNAVAPGYVETDMNAALLADEPRLRSISERIPAGRWGRPDDFDATVIFLAGSGSAYVSGHVLTVDGGWMGR